MSLQHALLTTLIERPCSGSELAKRFDKSIGYFWSATHQQIYRELHKLERAGWIKSLAKDSGRGRKKTYQICSAGRKELKAWIGREAGIEPVRSSILLKLRAEAALGPTDDYSAIEQQRALHQKKLELFRQIESRDFSDSNPAREKQLQHLVLKAGVKTETLWIELLEEALKILTPKE